MSSNNKNIKKWVLTALPFVAVGSILMIITFTSYTPHPGEPLYTKYCANCHGAQGEGLASLYPPLAGSDYLTKEAENVPCVMKYGLSGEVIVNGQDYNLAMPGIPDLTDGEITNIINYVNSSWGNTAPYQSLKETREQLGRCE